MIELHKMLFNREHVFSNVSTVGMKVGALTLLKICFSVATVCIELVFCHDNFY